MIGISFSLHSGLEVPDGCLQVGAKDYWENFQNIVRESSPHDSQSWIPTKVMSQPRSA